MVMTTGCVLDLGVWTISNAQVCPVYVSLCVCLSVCGNIIRYAWNAKMKNLLVSLSFSPPPPPPSAFPSPSLLSPSPLVWQDLWQEDRPHRYFPISLPPQQLCVSPTLITSWDLTAGRGRVKGKSQKWEPGAQLARCSAPWEWTSPNLATLLRAGCTWTADSKSPVPPRGVSSSAKTSTLFYLGHESRARSCLLS